MGTTLLNYPNSEFLVFKGKLRVYVENFQRIYQAQIAPQGEPIPLQLENIVRAMLKSEEFKVARDCQDLKFNV
jgi:hypothetical protein